MAEVEKVEVSILTNADGTAKSFNELTKTTKSLRNELSKVERGSKEYNRTLEDYRKVQNRVNELNKDAAAYTMNAAQTIGQLTSATAGVVSGFQAATSAMTIFGIENENVARSIEQLQAFQGLVSGLGGLATGFTSVTKLLPRLTSAFKALNTTLLTSPLFILAAVVIAIAAAFALFSSDAEDNTEAVESNTKALYDQERALRAVNIQRKLAVDLLKAQGGTYRDIYELEKSFIATDLAAIEGIIENLEKLGETNNVFLAQFRQQYQSLLDDLEKLDNQFLVDRTRSSYEAAQARIKAIREGTESILKELTSGIERVREQEDRYAIELEEKARELSERLRGYVQDALLPEDLLEELDETFGLSQLQLLENQVEFWQMSADAAVEGSNEQITALNKLKAAQEALDKYNNEQKKKQQKQRNDELKATAAFFSASTQLLGETTVAGKALAVAGATINAYAGASQVLANPTELNPYIKWAQFAATIVLGLANVKNILSTQVPNASDSSSGSPTASIPEFPEMDTSFFETHNNLDAYDEDIINQQQVVLVVEDVNEVQSRVKVAESNASF